MKKMLLYTVVLSLVPLWAQAQYTWNNTGSISTSSTCSASINNGSIVTNSSGAICQCSNKVASTYNWNCSASASSGTEVEVNGGSALTTSNQTGVLPYLCADTSGSGTAQSCTTTPTFVPHVGNCLSYTTTTESGSSLTLNVNGSGAYEVQIPSPSGWVGVYAEGQIIPGTPYIACYYVNGEEGPEWNVQQQGTIGSGGGGLSGMTAGQVPIAATASTVTSSKALAGSGTAITTGPSVRQTAMQSDLLGRVDRFRTWDTLRLQQSAT